ncbi:hypothetical protein BpHYR1_003417 [Brachionus plicatilis]|uniref:Uncharacterized protein n=1 Tax=Brachionus plicatilis TaxID=10195 RepID=A0A3M7RDB8_BRAPC|nr:hypothetical protein BpHYR1_003417 [Brachionus plicatilis]
MPEPDKIPSVVLNTLINEYNLLTILMPKLRQVQNFITNLRNSKLNTNSISNEEQTTKTNYIQFCHEQEKDFIEFYKAIRRLAKK